MAPIPRPAVEKKSRTIEDRIASNSRNGNRTEDLLRRPDALPNAPVVLRKLAEPAGEEQKIVYWTWQDHDFAIKRPTMRIATPRKTSEERLDVFSVLRARHLHNFTSGFSSHGRPSTGRVHKM